MTVSEYHILNSTKVVLETASWATQNNGRPANNKWVLSWVWVFIVLRPSFLLCVLRWGDGLHGNMWWIWCVIRKRRLLYWSGSWEMDWKILLPYWQFSIGLLGFWFFLKIRGKLLRLERWVCFFGFPFEWSDLWKDEGIWPRKVMSGKYWLWKVYEHGFVTGSHGDESLIVMVPGDEVIAL